MFLLGILWRRTTTAGALAAGLLTIPLSLALQWMFKGMAFQKRTGIVFWTCDDRVRRREPHDHAEARRGARRPHLDPRRLRLPPEERQKYRGLRRPVIWWAIVTAAVLFFYIRFA
jgi:SSS family solute:Na+ symporter